MKDTNKNSIDELLIRYLTGLATDNEIVEVEKWINSSEGNNTYYKKFKVIWEISPDFGEYQKIDTESSLKNVKKRISFTSQHQTKVKPLWMVMRIAAILVIFFGIYFIFSDKDKIPESLKMVKVESGTEIKTVVLPDSSIVTLNIASVLEYPEKFEDKERRINFEGEAYFEVSPDKSKPFIIETGRSETRVVGTAFNLKALTGEITESIIVTEGIVQFSGKTEKTKVPVRLIRGEKATLNTELKKEENTNPNFLAWKTGVLVFDNLTLEKALPAISDFYKVEFKAANAKVASYAISGSYRKLTLSEFIEVLEMTFGFTVEKKNETYFLNFKRE